MRFKYYVLLWLLFISCSDKPKTKDSDKEVKVVSVQDGDEIEVLSSKNENVKIREIDFLKRKRPFSQELSNLAQIFVMKIWWNNC